MLHSLISAQQIHLCPSRHHRHTSRATEQAASNGVEVVSALPSSACHGARTVAASSCSFPGAHAAFAMDLWRIGFAARGKSCSIHLDCTALMSVEHRDKLRKAQCARASILQAGAWRRAELLHPAGPCACACAACCAVHLAGSAALGACGAERQLLHRHGAQSQAKALARGYLNGALRAIPCEASFVHPESTRAT